MTIGGPVRFGTIEARIARVAQRIVLDHLRELGQPDVSTLLNLVPTAEYFELRLKDQLGWEELKIIIKDREDQQRGVAKGLERLHELRREFEFKLTRDMNDTP